MKNEISFIFVIYNDSELLKYAFPSIVEQEIKKKEIIIIDNRPSDKSREIINELAAKYNNVEISYYPHPENLGYSGGANSGIKRSKYKNVAILNADIILEKDYSKKILEAIYQDEQVAGATGKIMKYDFSNNTATSIIDTTGISLTRNLKAFDRGQGEEDLGQYDKEINIFGICGAVAVLKKEVLELSSINGEYFDEDFIAYKEDVDLSWRINKFSYNFLYVPKAIAYHGRALGKINDGTVIGTIINRKKQPAFLRELSLANQRKMIIKNMSCDFLYKNFIHILSRSIMECTFSIIFEPVVYVKSWKRTLKSTNKMLKKRKQIKRKLKNKIVS
ncbi:glycosyltransferase family 2 protein [Bacillus sp. WOD8 KX774193]|uniref:glycosyltransferase family 2 protein n=1 Tax=Bacillus sp. WOD8 KX774193 TaxID=3096776 RepID=UPI002DB9CDBE|nr:glycosyltransferase family 2 protein [Bacillus sp. WOD8 KX774193]MEC3856821.1 glycosyltransferase family 2 protein [Bacillus sp. WOD8 KX774193]